MDVINVVGIAGESGGLGAKGGKGGKIETTVIAQSIKYDFLKNCIFRE